MNLRDFRRFSISLLVIAAATGSLAQRPSTNHPAESAPAAETQEIPLDGAATPVTDANEYVTTVSQPGGGREIGNVSRATLTLVVPNSGTVNGAAVIVAPGGAFAGLAIDLEGFRVAHVLADHGITAFVLKYRLYPTSAKGDDADKIAQDLVTKYLANPDKSMDLQYGPALEDGIAAISLVRRNASKWNVDPKRVGIMGFSAGALTALSTVVQSDASKRPDFAGYIYGPEINMDVPADAPPLFVAIALDDSLFRSRGFPLIEAWQRAKRPVELHAYQEGGHGFGGGVPSTTTTLLMDEFNAWLEMNGFLKPNITSVQH